MCKEGGRGGESEVAHHLAGGCTGDVGPGCHLPLVHRICVISLLCTVFVWHARRPGLVTPACAGRGEWREGSHQPRTRGGAGDRVYCQIQTRFKPGILVCIASVCDPSSSLYLEVQEADSTLRQSRPPPPPP